MSDPHVHSPMTTLREQIATNVLTVTKFRELLRRMRENRPNDDLELIRKAYEFSQKHHSGQHRDVRRQVRQPQHDPAGTDEIGRASCRERV